MDVMQAISDRRSIRRFDSRPVARELVEKVLDAAVKAPSGKNMQPWRFVVVEGSKRDELVNALETQANAKKESGSALATAKAMRQAPVLIFIYDSKISPEDDHNAGRHMSLVHTQSIGAAIQNMLLAATSEGLGSLWICDVFTAEKEIGQILGIENELVAAVSLGYAAESPVARPRKPWREVTDWIEP